MISQVRYSSYIFICLYWLDGEHFVHIFICFTIKSNFQMWEFQKGGEERVELEEKGEKKRQDKGRRDRRSLGQPTIMYHINSLCSYFLK